jgi:hypothetical protein
LLSVARMLRQVEARTRDGADRIISIGRKLTIPALWRIVRACVGIKELCND